MKHNSTSKIIFKNTFTLFNIVNIILALMVASVGSYKNMLFIVIAIANTLISIINELRAKKIIDKMRLISEQRPTVIRDGKSYQIRPEEVAKGDMLVLALGDQILFDSTLETGVLEVNESFITGEQDNIEKHPGDSLVSGSFVVSGAGQAKVKNIGNDNFVNKLQSEARNIKTADSKLFRLMNNIVKYISWTLIPIGALLLWARFRTESDTTTAVTSTVAALINMIPEGLILLTSSVLALATIRLSRIKVLVQDLYSIETLARVDTIALDKTGTLTTGNMTVKAYKAYEKSFERALKSILSHQMSENATTKALKQKFLKTAKFDEIKGIVDVIPFSSDRKYSGIRTKNAEYLMGAIEFLTDDQETINKVKSFAPGSRVIAVVKRTEGDISKHCAGSNSQNCNVSGSSPELLIPAQSRRTRCDFDDCEPSTLRNGSSVRSLRAPRETILGIISLEDEIRPTAKGIIKYFYDNDISVKIISGDDLEAVTKIAETVGVKDLRGIELSSLKNPNYAELVKDYAIFTRVTPTQKKSLIKALKKQGNTVAMTGDGVNDILAMKEADCSIAIGEGSDAARRSAKLVLLDSAFDKIPSIIDEGRQSINNLERSTSLFLAKTVYASILAVVFVFLPTRYPFTPIEMSLLNFVCIGFPGLVLALEKNTSRIKDKFISNIKHYSVPTGLIIATAMITLSIVATNTELAKPLLSTLSASIVAAVDFVLIYKISRPLNLFRGALLFVLIALTVAALTVPFARAFFEFI